MNFINKSYYRTINLKFPLTEKTLRWQLEHFLNYFNKKTSKFIALSFSIKTKEGIVIKLGELTIVPNTQLGIFEYLSVISKKFTSLVATSETPLQFVKEIDVCYKVLTYGEYLVYNKLIEDCKKNTKLGNAYLKTLNLPNHGNYNDWGGKVDYCIGRWASIKYFMFNPNILGIQAFIYNELKPQDVTLWVILTNNTCCWIEDTVQDGNLILPENNQPTKLLDRRLTVVEPLTF